MMISHYIAIAQLLTARFQKAQLTKAVAEKAYQELTTNIPGKIFIQYKVSW